MLPINFTWGIKNLNFIVGSFTACNRIEEILVFGNLGFVVRVYYSYFTFFRIKFKQMKFTVLSHTLRGGITLFMTQEQHIRPICTIKQLLIKGQTVKNKCF